MPPGRLMFLRPIKSAAKERRSNRQYKPVWITAQVILLAFCVSLVQESVCVPFQVSSTESSAIDLLRPSRELCNLIESMNGTKQHPTGYASM